MPFSSHNSFDRSSKASHWIYFNFSVSFSTPLKVYFGRLTEKGQTVSVQICFFGCPLNHFRHLNLNNFWEACCAITTILGLLSSICSEFKFLLRSNPTPKSLGLVDFQVQIVPISFSCRFCLPIWIKGKIFGGLWEWQDLNLSSLKGPYLKISYLKASPI